jgi:hypothetical protein
MNVDELLRALNDEKLDYLLIGGMNFLLRHRPELTFDVDIWVRDDKENLGRLNPALRRLGAQWGSTEAEWAAVPEDWHWLERQSVFCLTTQFGALDVFREVRGLESRYSECYARSIEAHTATGIAFRGLSDEDMLACQEALPPDERKSGRMDVLRQAIQQAKRRIK